MSNVPTNQIPLFERVVRYFSGFTFVFYLALILVIMAGGVVAILHAFGIVRTDPLEQPDMMVVLVGICTLTLLWAVLREVFELKQTLKRIESAQPKKVIVYELDLDTLERRGNSTRPKVKESCLDE